MGHEVETQEVFHHCTALCAKKDVPAQGGPQGVLTLPPGRGSQVPGAPVLQCLLQTFPGGDALQHFVLSKGARGWRCKRGSQRGILVGQPGAAGSPRSSRVSPLHWCLEMLCLLPEPHGSRTVPACWTPAPRCCLLSGTAKPEPISSTYPPGGGTSSSDPQSTTLPLPSRRQHTEQDTRAGAQM